MRPKPMLSPAQRGEATSVGDKQLKHQVLVWPWFGGGPAPLTPCCRPLPGLSAPSVYYLSIICTFIPWLQSGLRGRCGRRPGGSQPALPQNPGHRRITLDIPAACMAGLIGPDGVGKSSLLVLMAAPTTHFVAAGHRPSCTGARDFQWFGRNFFSSSPSVFSCFLPP